MILLCQTSLHGWPRRDPKGARQPQGSSLRGTRQMNWVRAICCFQCLSRQRTRRQLLIAVGVAVVVLVLVFGSVVGAAVGLVIVAAVGLVVGVAFKSAVGAAFESAVGAAFESAVGAAVGLAGVEPAGWVAGTLVRVGVIGATTGTNTCDVGTTVIVEVLFVSLLSGVVDRAVFTAPPAFFAIVVEARLWLWLALTDTVCMFMSLLSPSVTPLPSIRSSITRINLPFRFFLRCTGTISAG